MRAIEVTPAKVIEMRLLQHGDRPIWQRIPSSHYTRKSSVFPELPDYPSVRLLFNKDYPWWTAVAHEDYVPEVMVQQLICRKEDMKPENNDIRSVFWSMRLSEVASRYGIRQKTRVPDQGFPFMEEIFAQGVLGSIVNDNFHSSKTVNKIGYRVKEEIELDELLSLHDVFLSQLKFTHSHPYNQRALAQYFGE